MAKRKTKFHKIVIHPNRFLVWAVVIALLVTGMLVSYIYIGNLKVDSELAVNTDVHYWHTYRDANVTFRYPAEWLIDPGTGYVGFGPKNQDSFLIFSYPAANDPAYTNYLKSANVRQITIDGKPAIRVIDNSSGKNFQRIAFVKNGKRLYELRGTTDLFDQILRTIHFLK